MTSQARHRRPRLRARGRLRHALALGLILTPAVCLLTFFGLVVISQAAGSLALDPAALQRRAMHWLGLHGETTTPTAQPTATLDFGPTSAPGLAPASSRPGGGPLPVAATPSPSGQAASAPTPDFAATAVLTETQPVHSATPSLTASPTHTLTQPAAASATATRTAATTSTATQPAVASSTPTPWAPTRTPTRTPSRSPTATATPSPTVTPTEGGSPAPSASPPAPTATQPPASATPEGSCSPTGNAGYESTLLGLINSERQGRGLAAYSPQSQLQAAARLHAADMACNHFFSHTGSNGSSVGQRVSAQGYSWSWVGENIFATGNASPSAPQQAFDWWMNSDLHRANLLSPNYTDIGLGYVYLAGSDYGSYFVAVFARP